MNILGYIDLFRKGSMVADPAAWKQKQITATVLGGFLMALLHVAESHGVDLPVSSQDVDSIATAVIIIVNVVLTFTTTDKIGILPAKRIPDADPYEDAMQYQPVASPDPGATGDK